MKCKICDSEGNVNEKITEFHEITQGTRLFFKGTQVGRFGVWLLGDTVSIYIVGLEVKSDEVQGRP